MTLCEGQVKGGSDTYFPKRIKKQIQKEGQVSLKTLEYLHPFRDLVFHFSIVKHFNCFRVDLSNTRMTICITESENGMNSFVQLTFFTWNKHNYSQKMVFKEETIELKIFSFYLP